MRNYSGKFGIARRALAFVFVLLNLLIIAGSHAAASDRPMRQADYGLRVQRYSWSEYGEDDFKLVDETGYLLGLAYDFESAKMPLGWRNGAELFFGQADYDGHTWSLIPIKTDVLYIGTAIYLDAVPQYRLDSGLLLKAFGGIGGRCWFRDLRDTKTDAGDPVSGSVEWWWCVYGRAGLGARYPLSDSLEFFTEAGVKLPIHAQTDAYFFVSGEPSARLKLDQEASMFSEIGLRWKRLSVKLAYDSLRFKRSDSVSSGQYELYQPKSKADILGLNVSCTCRF